MSDTVDQQTDDERILRLEQQVEKLTQVYAENERHEEQQEARITQLEEQVASLETALTRQSLRLRDQMAGFTELLGRSLFEQSQRIRASIVYPTTVRSVPDEEESNAGTVFLTYNTQREPVIYRESPTGMELQTFPGVDHQALAAWLDAREQSLPSNGSNMHRVNIYLDK